MESELISAGRSRSYSSKYNQWASDRRDVDLSFLYAVVEERQEPVRMTKQEIDEAFAAYRLVEVALGHPMLEGWLAAPLMGRTGRSLGLIQVADKVEGDFTDDDALVLLQLAQLAAVAIENAERFEHEHRIAETLQRSMLPQALPAVPGVELAARYLAGGAGAQVGGDWYDVVPLEDSRVLLAVGDVVGRGARAAAVMGQLRTATRAYAIQHLPMTVLMRNLDRLLQDISDGALATAVCLLLSPASGRVEVVSAGHPPPLLIAPDGTASYVECATHTPLGVLDAPVYTPTTIMLEPGATVLLYTDGLVEDRTTSLDEGFRNLAAAASTSTGPLEALCDKVLGELVKGETVDDVALLAARIS